MTDLQLVLALLVAAIVMFAANRPRMDAVGLLMLTLLPFTGVISMSESLAGFADANVVLLATLFVIGDGLVRTGVAQRIGDRLMKRAGSSDTRLLVLLMLAVGGLGAVMSSTGVVAIFIPIALRIAKATGTPAGRLMMPLSVAALSSGMITLVATAPNLVVNSELVRQGSDGFAFFDFTPIGAIVLLLSIPYMLFARRWLPAKSVGDASAVVRPSLRDWIDDYDLAGRSYRLRVRPNSPFVGRALDELDLRDTHGVNVLAVERRDGTGAELFEPSSRLELQAGDVLLVDLVRPGVDVGELQQKGALDGMALTDAYFVDRSQDMGIAEAMVAIDSPLVGRSVRQARIRSEHRLTVLGLRRGQTALRHGHLDEKLRVGDTLLLIGRWKEIETLRRTTHELVLLDQPAELEEALPAPTRAPHAVAVLLLVVALMVTGVVPNVQAGLIGVLLMGALGCVSFASSYGSIHWKSLVLIAGMMPFSLALQRTGAVELAADALLAMAGGAGGHALLASLFAVTAILGLFVSNTATAVLMAPVAIAVAYELQASPYPFAMIVALGASTAYMTPVSSPVNTLVVEPGGYAFADFLRVGVPFSLVVLIVSVILVPLLFPF
jgi:di/tricarboxylate transporter